MLTAFSLAAPSPTTAATSPTTVTWGKEPMRLSSTGPESTLPTFMFMSGAEEGGDIFAGFNFSGGTGTPNPYMPGTTCPERVWENTMDDLRVPQLPWAVQEDWGCERTPTEVDVLVAENDKLRAAITPQWGGKVWSLYDKQRKKQMFFNNPAHQPNNIGYRKAWTAGGCEWNWGPGKIGHSVFSEAPVWTAVLPTERGPVVRVWEYDRLNSSVWQVDMLFEDDVMYAHAKITNPTAADLRGYWYAERRAIRRNFVPNSLTLHTYPLRWTCVAMSTDWPSGMTRVVAPAASSVNEQCAAWPSGAWNQGNSSFRGADVGGCAAAEGGRGTCAWQQDMSTLGNIVDNYDFFMIVPEEVDPWIAHAREDGCAMGRVPNTAGPAHGPRLLTRTPLTRPPTTPCSGTR